ncbi:MAG: HIT domain-containing protein [Phycisphaeraceae bacterium]|nr:HIT domain-containing protein [Phycisphaeraceae bacterium]
MSQQTLWAPWRMEYIRQLDGEAKISERGCFLCEAAAAGAIPTTPTASPAMTEAGRKKLVLWQDERGMILLNRYPYTSGHLLVASNEHLADLTDLSAAQRAGLMELTALAEEVVRTAFNPQGINIGINLGRCAGAGLPGHLHVHVVPRWNGDTNFMQVVGQVRVIPQAVEESYDLLAQALAGIRKQQT